MRPPATHFAPDAPVSTIVSQKPPPHDADRGPRQSWILLILCLAAALYFLHLGRKSFWVDEVYSYTFAMLPRPDFWQVVTTREANMVLYYVLLRVWIVIGDTEFWIRSLSAIFALGAVVCVYLLARRLFGVRVALIAASLFAINPFVLAYAQEARGYTLFLLLAAAATILFVRALERSRDRDWIVYAAVIGLAFYSHLFAALTWLAHMTALVCLRRSALPWRGLVMSGMTVGLVVSPLAFFILTAHPAKLEWVREPTPRHLVGVFASMAGSKWVLAPYAGLVLVALATAIRRPGSVHDARRSVGAHALLVAWLVVPVAVAFAVSFVKPVFVNRYLLVGVAPLVILAASGLGRFRFGFASALLALIVGVTAPQLVAHYATNKQDWRAATQHIVSHAQAQDALLFYGTQMGRPAVEYYLKQIEGDTTMPVVVSLPDAAYYHPGEVDARRQFLQDLSRQHRRVWLVLSHHWSRDKHVISTSLQEVLGGLYTASNEWDFSGVDVLIYHDGEQPIPN